ncbi:MAG: MATE family efflux transporter [Chloroflexi bacterium]|nr:MATE family efflux transporter [Chloroflexota bacterium]
MALPSPIQRVFNYYRDRNYFREMLKLALPIIFQQAMFSLLNMAGVVFVGQKGETAIAAVGLAGQAAFLLNLVNFGVVSGAAMFTAQFWGNRDLPNLRRVLGMSLVLALFTALIFIGISQFVPEKFLSIYSTDPAVIALGIEYMRIFSWSFLLSSITSSYAMVMRSTGDVVTPTFVGAGALILNTILSWALIFGELGLPEMSINGAAVATVIARVLECAVLLFFVYRSKSPVAASLRELTDLNAAFMGRILKPMFPVILNELFWSLGITAYAAIYGRMGTDALAAVNIISSVEQVAFVIFIGISNATSVLVGNRIGAGDEEEAYVYAGRSLGIGVVGGLLMGLLLQVFKWPILSLYNVSPEVIQNASLVMNVASLFLWVRVNNMTIVVGILRAGGDTKFSLFVDGIIIWIVGVPLSALGAFAFHLPVYWVAVCVLSEEVTKWFFGMSRYRSRKWINNLAHTM